MNWAFQQPFGMICPDLEGFTRLVAVGSITMPDVYEAHPQIGEHVMAKHEDIKTKVKDALDHVREAAQELHGTISDAAAKRGGAVKADLEDASKKAKAATEAAKGAIGAQQEATKKHLTEAVTNLEAAQKHAAEGLKSSGQAFQTSIKQVVADARASVQKISEAIAAKRSAQSKKK